MDDESLQIPDEVFASHIQVIGLTMRDLGAQAAAEQAVIYANYLGVTPEKIMNEAAARLIRADDIPSIASGLEYFGDQAIVNPSLVNVKKLVTTGITCARASENEKEDLANTAFMHALTNLRFYAERNGFIPHYEFIETVTYAAANFDKYSRADLFAETVETFAADILHAAVARLSSHKPPEYQVEEPSVDSEEDSSDPYEDELTWALQVVAVELHEKYPDIAQRAYSYLPDTVAREYVEGSVAGSKLNAALSIGDFESARRIVRSSDHIIFEKIWRSMVEAQARDNQTTWPYKVFGFIDDELPDFFESIDSADYTEGADLGTALGYSGRLDILRKVINADKEQRTCELVAFAAARAFGTTRNEAGFIVLKRQVEHFNSQGIFDIHQMYNRPLLGRLAIELQWYELN